MGTSKTVGQILRVLELLKEGIIVDLLDGKDVSTDNAKDRVKDIVRDVAREFNVNDSTVSAHCVREIGLKTTAEFYNLAVRYITRQDEELEDIIVSNRKETIDSAEQTRVLLRKIRDN